MSYVNDNLMPNEKVLFSARIHPALFLPSVISFISTLFFGIYAFIMAGQMRSAGVTPSSSSAVSGAFLCFSAFFLLYTFLLGLQALITMLTTEFAVTNRRVIAKTGFIRRHTLEMLLSKIESVSVHQGILGRMLGYGTVVVTGTGGTKEGFKAITGPLAVRSKINQIIENNTRAFSEQQRTPNTGVVG